MWLDFLTDALVLYSDMVLLGNWFAPEHEYQVAIWNH
jgi:hypothetical protein